MSYVCTCGSDSKFIFNELPYALVVDVSIILGKSVGILSDKKFPMSYLGKFFFTECVLSAFICYSFFLHYANTEIFKQNFLDSIDNLKSNDSSILGKVSSAFFLARKKVELYLFRDRILNQIDDYSIDNFCILMRHDMRNFVIKMAEF